MNYSIPDSTQEIMNWQQSPVDEEMVAAAIAGVIKIVSSQGHSLDDLTAEVLADDPLLSKQQRRWLSQVVTQAWDSFA